MNIEVWLPQIVTAAVFAGGVKVALNGMREDVREIKSDVKSVVKDQAQLETRVSVLEARD